ncbi:hypothetical protein PATA110616_08690 [Paenibacillus tarimensis]
MKYLWGTLFVLALLFVIIGVVYWVGMEEEGENANGRTGHLSVVSHGNRLG